MHVNGKDYIIVAGGNINTSYISKVYVISFNGTNLNIVTNINLPVAYDRMSGCTLNVNGVDYAIFSGGRIYNIGDSKIYYILKFDGVNVKIVA